MLFDKGNKFLWSLPEDRRRHLFPLILISEVGFEVFTTFTHSLIAAGPIILRKFLCRHLRHGRTLSISWQTSWRGALRAMLKVMLFTILIIQVITGPCLPKPEDVTYIGIWTFSKYSIRNTCSYLDLLGESNRVLGFNKGIYVEMTVFSGESKLTGNMLNSKQNIPILHSWLLQAKVSYTSFGVN